MQNYGNTQIMVAANKRLATIDCLNVTEVKVLNNHTTHMAHHLPHMQAGNKCCRDVLSALLLMMITRLRIRTGLLFIRI